MHDLSNDTLSMTFDPDFKVTTFLEVEYRKNGGIKDKVTII